MYELTDPAAVSALIAAYNRGVDTRVILDAAFHGHETNAVAFQQLSDAGVQASWAPDGVIYHQKTVTVDDATAAVGMHEKILLTDNNSLIIGSQNLSTTSFLENRELSVVLDAAIAPELIAAVESTFDADYTAASAR